MFSHLSGSSSKRSEPSTSQPSQTAMPSNQMRSSNPPSSQQHPSNPRSLSKSNPTSPRRKQTFPPLFVLFSVLAILSLFSRTVSAQDLTSNLTGLSGTWSSGYGAVQTGAGFANPVNFTFTYPTTTGVSFSFTDDGYFEEAQYRYVANASMPQCVQAILIWQHGNYTINANNSLVLNPIPADGRIQVEDPCAAQTSQIYYYDQWEIYYNWTITNDLHHNAYMLQMYQFDGNPMPRLYLVARPPNMLPTTTLTTNDSLVNNAKANGVFQYGTKSSASRSLTLPMAGLAKCMSGVQVLGGLVGLLGLAGGMAALF